MPRSKNRRRQPRQRHQPPHVCLFSGELAPELAAAAPYLVQLDPESAFTAFVLGNGWDQHWGIIASVPAQVPFRSLRGHFRSFLRVRGPDDDVLLFRYYDPRVFRAYLPTCDAEELAAVYGPVGSYAMEGATPETLVRFRLGPEATLQETVVSLAERPSATRA